MPSTPTDRLNGLTTSVAVKAPCKAYTTSTITQSGEQTIGGVACVDGDRYLRNVSPADALNGIWVVRTGAHERAKDFDGNRDVVTGTQVLVVGSGDAATVYRVTTTGDITIGTTAIEFTAGGVSDSASINFVPAGVGAETRSVQSKLRDTVSVLDFGAVGDGVADDSDAVEAAIESGFALDWLDKTYRVTRELVPTITGAIRWTSRGATIQMDAASPVRSVLRLIVGAGSHRINGDLNIDANLDAYIGMFLNNEGTTYPTDFGDFFADGLRVANVYRSGTTHSGGDGIWIRGAWRSVTLVRPVVENCRLAAGAGVSGSQGIFGITFSGNGTQDPRNMTVIDPYVASVLSEDATYTDDQDGLRAVISPGSAPSESRLTIVGGTFRNCYGRSIKSQAEHTSVKGSTFIRTQGFTRGYGNEEIDCQEGGGSVENINCIYNGSAPDEIVLFSTTRQASKVSVPFGSIRGLKAVVHSGTTLNRVWRNAIPIASITAQVIKVSDVEVTGSGALTNVCYFAAANSGTGFHLLMSDVVAGPTGEWVVCTSGTGSGTLKASRVVHTGGSPANFKSTTSGNFRPFASISDAINFNEANSANNTTTPVGVLQRIDAIAPNGASAGGLVRFENFQLADGAAKTLTPTVGSLASSAVLISVAASRSTHALASFDSTNGASIVAQPSTSFVAGTTSDPGSGAYRVWYSSGPVISNNSGATRSFTCIYIG